MQRSKQFNRAAWFGPFFENDSVKKLPGRAA
jgi:hypothetical protein